MVKYSARRVREERGQERFEDISREIVGCVPGDPDEQMAALARILAPKVIETLSGNVNDSELKMRVKVGCS